MWMMCEAKLTVLKFDRRKQRFYRKKRANSAYHLLVPLFSSFMDSVVCHMLPLFGKSLLGIISFGFLYDFFHSHSASAFFSGFVCFYTDPVHNQPSLESAMPRAPVLETIRRCGTNVLRSFVTEVRTYIYACQSAPTPIPPSASAYVILLAGSRAR